MPTIPSGPVLGQTILWGPGGLGLTLNGPLTNGSARQGVKSGDLLYLGVMPAYISPRCRITIGASTAAGALVEYWFGESSTAAAGSDNPGGLSGTDAAFSSPADWKLHLARAGSIPIANASGTAQTKVLPAFVPSRRYIIPVVVNLSGASTATSPTDSHIVELECYYNLTLA